MQTENLNETNGKKFEENLELMTENTISDIVNTLNNDQLMLVNIFIEEDTSGNGIVKFENFFRGVENSNEEFNQIMIFNLRNALNNQTGLIYILDFLNQIKKIK